MHSPFVFDFIEHVLNDRKQYPVYQEIEQKRNALLRDNRVIVVEDFGAGSLHHSSFSRKVSRIAATSLKPKKYAQLLFRIVRYFQPASVVELGTSLGVTTAYLAAGNPAANVVSFEGSASIASIASTHLSLLQPSNVQLIQGDFNQTLPLFLANATSIDLVFIDGNHRKSPTLDYFTQCLHRSTDATIMMLDDIHWSAEMEAAWEEIKNHPAVTLSIDLFFIGIVFFRKDFKVKQHFAIQF